MLTSNIYCQCRCTYVINLYTAWTWAYNELLKTNKDKELGHKCKDFIDAIS